MAQQDKARESNNNQNSGAKECSLFDYFQEVKVSDIIQITGNAKVPG
jgi:hypothetical protein